MDTQEPIRKKVNKNGLNYYIQHLNIVNSVLSENGDKSKMVGNEIKIIAKALSFSNELLVAAPFGTLGRKFIREEYDFSHSSLSGALRTLIVKKHIYRDELDVLQISKDLIPNKDKQLYAFILNRYDGEKAST